MSDRFGVGIYKNINSNYDTNFTAERAEAKWRSQYAVDGTPDVVAESGDFYLLPTQKNYLG
ncbi:hypothetical protein [Pleurocapsa sp. FMAR1]|uniref:hypothetical protein n=1 Tax=Pleurocapsa sp. FMAR1 TaxID=3040204 RepID=UPI0029C8C0B0|nr:hypothetical protein [Pleurocapsa sp. FMAR1]